MRTFAVFAGLLAFLFLARLDEWSPSYVMELYDFGHIPLFGVLSLSLFNLMYRDKGKERGAGPYIHAGFLTFLLGLLTECIQVFLPHRYFQIGDILYDALGAAGFLSLRYVMDHKGMNRAARRAILSMFVLSMGVALIPFARAVLDAVHMHRNFPMISSFEKSIEMSMWRSEKEKLSRTGVHATHGAYCLKVPLVPGTYSGASTRRLIRDWQGYESLLIDFFIPGKEPLKFTVRINDTIHNDEYQDRYNKSFLLQPGFNEVKIPLIDVFNAPTGRTMDMGSIGLLCMFSWNLKKERTVYIDNIRLSKGP